MDPGAAQKTRLMKDKAFGNRLKLLRKQKGLVQTDLPPLIGISYKAIQDHEGGRWPNRKNRQKYLDFYGCNEDWFLTGKGEAYDNKGRQEGLASADGEGLWGRTRHYELDGKGVDVTLFTPPGSQSEPENDIDEAFDRAVGGLRRIFNSGDPTLITAIRSSITAFVQTALKDQYSYEQSKRIQKLEDECEALKKQISDLKKMIGEGDALAGAAKTGTDTIEQET